MRREVSRDPTIGCIKRGVPDRLGASTQRTRLSIVGTRVSIGLPHRLRVCRKSIPSLRMRDRSVCGLISRMAAAPSGPSMRPRVRARRGLDVPSHGGIQAGKRSLEREA